MDLTYAYENNGYKEARNQLREDERAYLYGYSKAVEDVENYIKYNIDVLTNADEDTTLGKAEIEIIQNAGARLTEILFHDWHEIAVGLLDRHGDDESDGTGKISQSWKLPEPPELEDDE